MKNLKIIAITSIATLFTFCFMFSCKKSVNEIRSVNEIKEAGITSQAEFQTLLDKGVYPLNKIKTTRSNTEFVFNEGILIGWKNNSIVQNFTFDEYVAFLKLITGRNSIAFIIDPGQPLDFPLANYEAINIEPNTNTAAYVKPKSRYPECKDDPKTCPCKDGDGSCIELTDSPK